MKKPIALLLAATMMLPNQAFALTDSRAKEPPAHNPDHRPEQMLDSSLEPIRLKEPYAAEEMVTAIIELHEDPLTLQADGMRNEKILLREQNDLERKISRKVLGGEDLEVLYHYTTVTNGFAAVVPYGKLEEIRALPEVSSAYVAPEFKVAPDMPTHTTELGGLENASGYKGEGTVIAIVDSGLAMDHLAFAAAPDAPALAQENVAAAMERNQLRAVEKNHGSLTASQVYHGGKVPFAYDYADRDLDVNPGNAGDHGTHVAGIAAANAGVAADVVGVAPEAQLLAMKVFSSHGSNGATWDDILAAMDDAVYLGADVINLSLGSTCGFTTYEWEEGVTETFQRVTDAGVSLSVACGNEYSAAFFNRMGKSHALTQNPDYGTVGSPASYGPSLAVASVEKRTTLRASYLTVGERKVAFNDIAEADDVNIPANVPSFKSLGTGKPLDYVVVPGIGDPGDYIGLTVSGKIALVSRGNSTYETKKNAARDAGAAGILIYNNEPGMSYMEMDKYDLPAAFISQADGKALAAVPEDQRKLTISAQQGELESPTSGQMSDFSSWGVTPELTLKPDITAPGGNIKSTTVNGGYTTKSGTSMAAPFVSGAMAVVRQYVERIHPTATTAQLSDLVDALLMSTAVPVTLEEIPYSPRKQGAGLVNVDMAVSSPAYLTVGAEGRPKLELGDDARKTGTYTMSFQVHNWSEVPVTYTLGGTVQTDGAEITKQYMGQDVWQVTELPYLLEAAVPVRQVEVPAGETVTVTATVTLTAADKAYLDEHFANGGYVEGFLTLTPADGGPVLSLPYMGFYGDWTRASVIDRGYYWDDLTDQPNWATQYTNTAAATSLEGTVDTYLGDNPYHQDVPYLQDRSAISPNGDDYMDRLDILYTGLLRNVETLTYTISNPEDPAEIYYQQDMDHVSKSVYSGNYYRIVPAGVDSYTKLTPWDGKNHGISLPNNSKALVTVSCTLPFDRHPVDNECLSWSFPVTIDTEEPTAENITIRNEGNKFFVDLTVHDNQYVSNVCFADATGDKFLSSYPVAELTPGVSTELSYDVTGLGQKLTLIVNDYAGNRREYDVKVEGNVDESQLIVPTKPVFTEDFETPTFPANGWTLKNQSAKTWYQGMEYGSKMACCAVSHTEQQNEWLISPVIDLSQQTTQAGMIFDYYANYFWSVEQHDYNLKVKATVNGKDWEDIWQLWDVKKEFGPWEKTQAKVIIPEKFQKSASLQLALVYEGLDGTELYLDNVQVYVEDPAMVHTITATAGQGGTITPEGEVRITDGMDRTFTITPDEGYILADVKVDGKSVGPKESYLFEKVTADHTIEASFSAKEGGSTGLLIDEDFEKQALPAGWALSGINKEYTWKAYKYYGRWGVYCPVDRYDPDPSYNQPGNPQDERVILPAVDLAGKESAALSFQFSGNKRELSRGNMTATVEISTDKGASWKELWNAAAALDSLKEGIISDYVGTGDITLSIPGEYLLDGVQLAFRYQHPRLSDDGGPVFVDNVKLLATGGSTAPDPEPSTPPVSSDLLNEDFEGQKLPEGWEIRSTNASASYTWQIKKYFGRFGGYCDADLYEEDTWGGGWSMEQGKQPLAGAKQDERLVTPALALNGKTGTLSFQFTANPTCIKNSEMTATAEVTKDDGKTWTPLWNAKDHVADLKKGVISEYVGTGEFTLDIPADFQTDGVRFAFRYERPAASMDGALVFVDNVKVTAQGGGTVPDPDPEPSTPPVSSDLLNEDFEGQKLPEGWSVQNTNSAFTWQVKKYIKSFVAKCDADLYEEDSWGWSMEQGKQPLAGAKQDERLVTPALALNGRTGTLSFQFTAARGLIRNEDMTVSCEITADQGKTWTPLWNAKDTVEEMKEGTFSEYVHTVEVVREIPAEFCVDGAQICFRYQRPGYSVDGGPAMVDNVIVTSRGGADPEPPASSFTIAASAGQGGNIAPRGTISVEKNTAQTFTVTAGKGYEIADVLVDGKSVGAVPAYTFENVTADHTIAASFRKLPEELPTSIQEDFNSAPVIPENWHVEGISADRHYETWKIGRFDALGATNVMLCTQNIMFAQFQKEYLFLPEITMPEKAVLKFDFGGTYEHLGGFIDLTVQATVNKGASWTTLWDVKDHLPQVPDPTQAPKEITGKGEVQIPADFCVPGVRFAFVFESVQRSDGVAAIDNVTLNAGDTTAPELYSITVAPMAHGKVEASKSVAKEGETITLTVTPDPGYQLKAGSLVAGDIVVKDNSFVMPGKAVEITALFEEVAVPPVTPAYRDGVYQGQAQGKGGPVKVEVTVTNGAIAKVKVLSQNETPSFWEQAKAMVEKLLNLDNEESIRAVDAVTGATISSRAIQNAVLNALEQAVELDSGIFAAGDGSVEHPWLIRTVKQLTDFAAAVNGGEDYKGKFIALDADLSLKGLTWTPIGTSDHEKYTGFAGSFDGRGHTVRDLTCGTGSDTVAYEAVGFFGVVTSGGTVRNLNLQIEKYYNSCVNADVVFVGGLVGILDRNATVDHCTVIGEDQAIVDGSGRNGGMGGIAGKMLSGSVIASCWTNVGLSYGTINPEALDVSMGGIVGIQKADSLVANCASFGSVPGMVINGVLRIGGLAGSTAGALYNCYTTSLTKANVMGMEVSKPAPASTAVGHLIGCSETGAALYQCYYDVNAPQFSNVDLAGEPSEGKAERRQAAGWDPVSQIKTDLTHVTGNTAAQLMSQAFADTMNDGLKTKALREADTYFKARNLLTTRTVVDSESAMANGFWRWILSGGAVILDNTQELNVSVENVAILDDLVVAIGTSRADLPLPGTVAVTMSNNQVLELPVTWSCESYDGNTAASYTFVGAPKLPEGITNPGNHMARIIVRVQKDAPARYDITVAPMTNGSVQADKTTAQAGETVTLTVKPAPGYQLKVGSLKANDQVVAGSSFTMPAAAVTVTAAFEPVSVPPTDAKYADGVYQGQAQGKNGPVKVEVTVTGGVIAKVDVLSQNETPSFWQKAVAVLEKLLGLGDNDSVRAVDAVTNATVSSEAIKNAVLNALEQASAENSGIFAAGDGSEQNPWLIRTVKQLTDFAASVNGGENYKGKYVALDSGLSLKDVIWTPIGTSDHEKYTGFAGTFDGQGHTIRDLTCGTGSATVALEAVGFFGVVETGGTVRNLNVKVEKCYNSCMTTTHTFMGGIAAILGRNAVIDHCTVLGVDQAMVDGSGVDSAMGGLVGKMLPGSVVANSWSDVGLSYGTINPEALDVSMGGIVGIQGADSLVVNCASFGSVPGMVIDGVLRIGGLAGRTAGALYNCYTTSLTKANILGMDVTKPVAGTTAIGHLIGCSDTGAALYRCFYDRNAPQFNNVDLAGEPSEGKPERRQAAGWDPVSKQDTDLSQVTACDSAELLKAAFADTMNDGLKSKAITEADRYFTARQLLKTHTVADYESLLNGGFYRWEQVEGRVLLTDTQPLPVIVAEVGVMESLSVPYGTEESALKLPTVAYVRLTNGTTVEMPVTWSSKTYSPTVSANHIFSGTLTLPQGVTNPEGIKATIAVLVGEKPAGGGGSGGGSSGGGSVGPVAPAPETETRPDGTRVETVTKPDGTTVETAKKPDGTTSTTTVAPDGTLNSNVEISGQAAEKAEQTGKPVELPLPGLPVTSDPVKAPVVHVGTGSRKPVTIEIPVKNPTSGTVAVVVAPDGTEQVIRNTRVTDHSVIVTVADGTSVKVADRSRRFVDVADSQWFAGAVDFVVAHSLFGGTSATTFEPDTAMTRAMLVRVLHNLENNPDTADTVHFDDVADGQWYSESILWAAEKGIVNGYGTTFGPEDPITREQLAVILWRYCGSPASEAALTFADADTVSDYAGTAMSWAVESGILNGMGGNRLEPQGAATRAQVAAMMMRLINLDR